MDEYFSPELFANIATNSKNTDNLPMFMDLMKTYFREQTMCQCCILADRKYQKCPSVIFYMLTRMSIYSSNPRMQ